MLSKSSQNRKPTSNRVPKKWRNLPPAGHGITPEMKARPVIEREPIETDEGYFEDEASLMPVPMTTFIQEHAEMLERGYHPYAQGKAFIPCCNCGRGEQTFMHYAKRHRNGKPNYDFNREFHVCPECLHVSETTYIDVVAEKAIEEAAHQEGDEAA